MRSLARLIVVVLCWLPWGCTLPYSAFPGKEAAYFPSPSDAKRVWSHGQLEDKGLQLQCVALTSDGSLLAGGDKVGRAFLWKVDSSDPPRAFEGSEGIVLGLLFTPDDHSLITASIQELEDGGFSYGAPVSLTMRDLATGRVMATATDHGLHPVLRIDAAGRYLAVTTESGFFLHDARSLELLHFDKASANSSVHRTWVQPAFFRSDSDGSLDILACGMCYRIPPDAFAAGGAPRPKALPLSVPYPDQPDAWTGSYDGGFYVERPTPSEAFLFPFYFKCSFGGIAVAPLDRRIVSQFISPDKLFDIHALLFIPPSRAYPAGRLVAGGPKGVMLLDLSRRHFWWVRKEASAWRWEDDTLGIGLSADRTRIAACGYWGAAVWQLPR